MGLGVAVTAAVILGLSRLLPIGGTTADPSAGVVVVLPFKVYGDFEPPLDSVSITKLLGNFFGRLERYRVVPAELVRQTVEQLCPQGQIERFCGSQVAMELGVQFHLTGTVTAVRGDSVYIVASLTEEPEGRRPVPPTFHYSLFWPFIIPDS